MKKTNAAFKLILFDIYKAIRLHDFESRKSSPGISFFSDPALAGRWDQLSADLSLNSTMEIFVFTSLNDTSIFHIHSLYAHETAEKKICYEPPTSRIGH
jgi:hypothetical protein